jgi:hypothetical protein
MSRSQFLALLGFAFAAAWIGFNFGYALLCLLGAAVFYAAGAVMGGELDLGELQSRLGSGGQASTPQPAQRAAPPRVR